MIRVAWLTDLHLDFAEPEQVRGIVDQLERLRVEQVLISGDIGEAPNVGLYLESLAVELGRPLAFVLGNHDFYRSSIHRVRGQIAELCSRIEGLNYLTQCEHLVLTPNTALVGHDGWADGRAGNYERSQVMLSDYVLIAELAGLGKAARRLMLEALGDDAARHIRRVLPPAAAHFSHVVLVTHVPPLREACWHDGRVSDDDWAPHFTCQAMGEAILEIMRDHPATQLTVLCGHTHGAGETRPLENVRILTGGAEYGRPRVTDMLELP
jgi:3',5'-cyclic AMP phosphodiesterase CpdA